MRRASEQRSPAASSAATMARRVGLPTREPPPVQRSASAWIIEHHDAWSRLTLSSFYQDLEENSLNATQFARWLLDRTSISMAVYEAATRVSLVLGPQASLPLLNISMQNAKWLAEYTTLNGLDINSKMRLSHAAKRLVELIETTTAPSSPPAVAITTLWGYMLASWQAWSLCLGRGRPIPREFDSIAKYISREESIQALVETQDLLDGLLNEPNATADFSKAGKTFEEVARRASAVLDQTLYMGETGHVPLCICGRKGHMPSQCTFKSHI